MKRFTLSVLCLMLTGSCALAADGLHVPNVPPALTRAAQAIYADPAFEAALKEATSPEGQKWRFNTLMELVRIASPSRSELRRQAEITRRLVEDWGFSPEDIMTTPSGRLPGAGLQVVDGLPVYNVCVRIPGSYAARPDAQSWRGAFPKVLLEGHIDTVNPGVLPPAESPYEPVKLQKASDPIVKTREELAAIADELHFDARGRIIEDEAYERAYRRCTNLEDAKTNGGYRLYVPGYADAMVNTVGVLQAAILMKKHRVRPVYDIWVCGTAGEEGKGNLCGMKQLYGYSQDAGKGNNALNIVANFSCDTTRPGGATTNYLGSYRFEIEYREPKGWKIGDTPRPSAAMAMSRALAAIADLKTPYDADKKAERTTYTAGVARCTPSDPQGRSEACTLMVDMRSATQEPLSAIRAQIEPQFQKAMDAENAKYGLKAGDEKAVAMKLVWFGDRPAHQRTTYDDIALCALWEASRTIGIDPMKGFSTAAQSLNDNIPAAIGVPTVNFNLGTPAASGGGHTWYEWGIPGPGADEGKRVLRLIMTGLLTSGVTLTSGETIEPGTGPVGSRTTEEIFE